MIRKQGASCLQGLTLASLVAAGVCGPFGARGATTRVDDSGTVVSEAIVPMRWRQLVPGRVADHAVQASVRVAVRLNMARWVNRPIRLYMALPVSHPGEPVYASWQTRGRLLPGSLRSGGRTLVFDGVIGAPLLEESFELTLRTDGRALVSPQALHFYFEIDTP